MLCGIMIPPIDFGTFLVPSPMIKEEHHAPLLFILFIIEIPAFYAQPKVQVSEKKKEKKREKGKLRYRNEYI